MCVLRDMCELKFFLKKFYAPGVHFVMQAARNSGCAARTPPKEELRSAARERCTHARARTHAAHQYKTRTKHKDKHKTKTQCLFFIIIFSLGRRAGEPGARGRRAWSGLGWKYCLSFGT